MDKSFGTQYGSASWKVICPETHVSHMDLPRWESSSASMGVSDRGKEEPCSFQPALVKNTDRLANIYQGLGVSSWPAGNSMSLLPRRRLTKRAIFCIER
ncbi:hypothetical protein TNIN_415461 [Trichonephila inaurata madagascariensis]|uniref:Uncharacterized protein n=1 Tax=Trichonephila inaurata madagascariensis TaxID=2747483 RepID=A0A8X6YK55_9ARAC|nr:hypothetical protein TNIN_415461 [Trichonephila inaurata madagascariensis]